MTIKQSYKIIVLILAWACTTDAINNANDNKHYYCIPSDEKHYHLLKNLIGSIHHVDFERLGQVAVFDLGFTGEQLDDLGAMEKVCVYNVEKTHPEILTYFDTAPSGRKVRGYFAWKPVIIKQALEMFPYVLYLDAGTTVLKSPHLIFDYIREQGYFLISCTKNPNCNIINRITKTVVDEVVSRFDESMQRYLLDDATTEIDAGLQGVARGALAQSYIMPLYELSKNLELFKDDGSARYGYGEGRHDQILFSIYAHALKLKIHDEGWIQLPLKSGDEQVHLHWDSNHVDDNTVIYRSRHDLHFQGGHTQYVKYVDAR